MTAGAARTSTLECWSCIPEQRLANQAVHGDDKSSNRRKPQRQRGRGQQLPCERHQRSGRALMAALVEQPPEQHGQVDEVQESPHVVYLRKLEREQVQQAIESLPDAYREIVVLRDIEGFTYQEIATVLDCPAGTVMSRLGRARGKLRKLLSTWQTKSRIKAV